MKCLYNHNVGGIDRALRIIVGLALLSYGFYTMNYWFALGLVPLLTGIFAFCPFYPICKCSTAKGACKVDIKK